MLDIFKRRQNGLKMEYFFPERSDGYCACGCNRKLKGRQQKWASEECSENAYKVFAVLKGNTGMIRKILFQLEKGFCRKCGVYDESWEADHVIPVFKGGGFSGIENFQTLCPHCHKEKTFHQMASHRAAISSHADSIAVMDRLKALEATE